MKKGISVFWMLTALTGAIVFCTLLAGCGEVEDNSLLNGPRNGENYSKEAKAKELADKLGGDKASVNGATVTLTDNVTLDEDIKVEREVTLIVGDKELKVEDGVTLTVAGTVRVKSGGTLISPALNPDGSPKDGKIAFDSGGRVLLEKGSTGFYGESLFISSVKEGDDISNGPIYKWDTVPGATVTLTNLTTTLKGGNVTAIKDTGVAAKTTIVVDNASTLTIAENITFQVGGKVDVSKGGTFNLAGNIIIEKGANLDVSGTYIAEGDETSNARAAGTNNGTITIKSGGVTWGKNVNIDGTGFTVVETGGKAYLGGDEASNRAYMIGTEDAESGEAANTVPVLKIGKDSSLSFNNTDYELKGTAYMNGVPNAMAGGEQGTNSFFVGYCATGTDPNNRILTLKAGSKLTIKGGDITDVFSRPVTKKVLGVVVYGTEPGIKGEADAQIILESNGHIDIYTQTGNLTTGDPTPGISEYTQAIGNISHNFYDSEGAKEPQNAALTNKTYKWNATAGGTADKPGWKAEPPQQD
jgi:hypothetical protein